MAMNFNFGVGGLSGIFAENGRCDLTWLNRSKPTGRFRCFG